ncbi:MAG: hypothetical protein K6G61_11770 [Solobacterium sp.]|nr:hypothetical protein [Solobacterium sp.]
MRRLLSVLLALFIVFGFLPVQANAEETGETAVTFENDDEYYYITIICHAGDGVFDASKISEGEVSEDKKTLTYTGKVLYENLADEGDDPYYESFLINMPPKKGISRKGYKFAGWYINEEAEGEFDGMPGVDKYEDEIEVYAAWNEIAKIGWRETDKGWRYCQVIGDDYTNGIYDIGGKKYGFDEDGYMVKDWKKFDGIWHYFLSSGVMATGWEKISGKWYYFDLSGNMTTGWKKLSGKWYYFKGSGAMVTSWQKISGKWYYFTSGGAMVTGWKKIGGKWYYFQSSGVMKTGWLKLSGKWYYLDSSGAMVTGTRKIGSKTYTFSSSGVCLNP